MFDTHMEQAVYSKQIYEKNMAAFEQRYGQGLTRNVCPEDVLVAGVSRSKELVVYRKLENGLLRINSAYSPGYEAERWSQKIQVSPRRMTIAIFGFSTGVYLRALMAKLRPDTFFYIYEPFEELFVSICGYEDITDIILNENVSLFVGNEQKVWFSDELQNNVLQYNTEVVTEITPYYQADSDFDYAIELLKNDIENRQKYAINVGRIALKARMYAWNHMQRGYLFTDLQKNIPEDAVAVIVAAGPSLKKNVKELKNIFGHAIIFATDRSVGVLDENGIVPDFIVSIDARKGVEYVDFDVAKNVPMIASYQVNVDIQKLFKDRIIYFLGHIYEYGLIGEKTGATTGADDSGGNVAGAAFCACLMLGIKTIVLIGQDLAYLNGKHHADDIETGKPALGTCMTVGIDGGMVETNGEWIAFKDFYERQIISHPEVQVIDATEGGALIRGSKVMPLKSVTELVKDKACTLKGVLSKMPRAQTYDECIKTRNVLKVWLQVLDNFCENSKDICRICKSLLDVCNNGDISDDKYDEEKQILESIRADINISVVNFMMEEYWIGDMTTIPDETLFLRNNEEAAPVLKRVMDYYTKFPEYCVSLKKELLSAITQGESDMI